MNTHNNTTLICSGFIYVAYWEQHWFWTLNKQDKPKCTERHLNILNRAMLVVQTAFSFTQSQSSFVFTEHQKTSHSCLLQSPAGISCRNNSEK